MKAFCFLSTCLSLAVAFSYGSSWQDGNYMRRETWLSWPISQTCVLLMQYDLEDKDDASFLVHSNRPGNNTCSYHGGHIADFSNCHLTDISQLPSNISSNITDLILSDNEFTEIPEEAFARFSDLRHLNLSRNNISVLHNLSFKNLTALRSLDLQGNNLSMKNSIYPANVFQPLISLTKLWINNNTRINDSGFQYPDYALAKLTKLQSLYMDGIAHEVLGEGFSNLTELTNLTFAGHPHGWCNLQSLSNETFRNVAGLRSLTIRYCQIQGDQLHPDAFTCLENLERLDIRGNDAIHLTPLINAIKNLTNLTHLNMNNIINPYSPGQCVTVDFAKNLPRKLLVLQASSNSLQSVEHGVLQNLPENLTCLQLNDNRLIFGEYLQEMYLLQNLRHLELNGGTGNYNLPTYLLPDSSHQSCCNNSRRIQEEARTSLIFPMPPELETLQMTYASLSYSLTEFNVNTTNKLQYLSLDGNNFPTLVGPITGLNKLIGLSMQRCNIRYIKDIFFNTFSSLTKLNLASNVFGETVLNNMSTPIFTNLTNLEYLNLNFADLGNLNVDAFQGLSQIKEIHLQKNIIWLFEVNISHMSDLQFIDLYHNSIHSLSTNMMRQFDNISKTSPNLTIDLSHNPIYCDCQNLEFIEWMIGNNFFRASKESKYKCTYTDKKDKDNVHYRDEYFHLKRQCKSNYDLFLIAIFSTLICVSFILGAIIYRFRWKIRYLYYSAYIYYTGAQMTGDSDDRYEYDVFISYVHEDEEFAEGTLYSILSNHGVRVFIHGLHFKAGEHISSNIVNAVQASKRTLVVLTKDHIKSVWGTFEVQMAIQESACTGRKVLIFLIMENLNKAELSTQLLYQIQNNTYIRYPDNEESQQQTDMEQFWTRLAKNLKS